ncbi:MAG: hypothetical protein FWC56_03705 [Phycisphaerae bacterium]|nr:hypothetical protein [Phycisphaerae bacterium]
MIEFANWLLPLRIKHGQPQDSMALQQTILIQHAQPFPSAQARGAYSLFHRFSIVF